MKQATEARLPLGRVCDPEDVAMAILSLIEGSIVVGKSYRDPRPLIRSIRSFGQYARHIAGVSHLRSTARA